MLNSQDRLDFFSTMKTSGKTLEEANKAWLQEIKSYKEKQEEEKNYWKKRIEKEKPEVFSGMSLAEPSKPETPVVSEVKETETVTVDTPKPGEGIGKSLLRSVIPPKEEKGFVGSTMEDIGKRAGEVKESFQARKEAPVLSAFNVATSPIKLGWDVIGNFIGDAVKSIPGAEWMGEQAKEIGKGLYDAIKSTRTGAKTMEDFEGFIDDYTAWAEEHPEAAKAIGGALDIFMIPTKPAQASIKAAKKGFTIPKGEIPAGTKWGELAKKLDTSVGKNTLKRAEDLIMPFERTSADITKALKENPYRVQKEGGWFTRGKLEPTIADKEAFESLSKIIGKEKKTVKVKPIIIDEIGTLARETDRLVSTQKATINPVSFKNELGTLYKDSSVMFKGDAALENAYNSTVDTFMGLMEGKKWNNQNLLNARRQFYRDAKTKITNPFDVRNDIKKQAIADIGTSTNKFIVKTLPEKIGIKVEGLLKEQSKLYDALAGVNYNIAKFDSLAKYEKLMKKLHVGGVGGAVVLGASATVAAAILASPLALTATLAGSTVIIGKRIITSDNAKRMMSELFKKLSGLKQASKADKVAFKQFIEMLEEKPLALPVGKPSVIPMGPETTGKIIEKVGPFK